MEIAEMEKMDVIRDSEVPIHKQHRLFLCGEQTQHTFK